MYKKLLLYTLIDQEKRAANLFLFMLMTIILFVDILNTLLLSERKSPISLIPYGVLILCLPMAVYFVKNKNPRFIKYLFFFAYTIANLLTESYIYSGVDNYTGGNVAEVFFILFSPIFINKKYFYTVTIGTFVKYALVGLIFSTTEALLPMALIIVLALVAFIILTRFFGYLKATNESFFKQFEGVVKGIISTLELKDPYTRGHSQRVAKYSVILAEALKIYSDDDLKLIYHACLLHDVGKVHTPDYILSKPAKLTPEEYEIVKQHPIVGAQAIKDIDGLELCLDIVLYHHERWDGKGYPEGLKETQIPITARIAAIADSFDAMTTQRSYREAMTADEAYKQIIEGKGSQFDPALVEYFDSVFSKWKEILEKSGQSGTTLSQSAATTFR